MSDITLRIPEKINEVSDGNIGVLAALMHARKTIGDKHLDTFFEKVPEKGSDLWLRFKAFQKASKDKGDEMEMNFNHFIVSIVTPVLDQ